MNGETQAPLPYCTCDSTYLQNLITAVPVGHIFTCFSENLHPHMQATPNNATHDAQRHFVYPANAPS